MELFTDNELFIFRFQCLFNILRCFCSIIDIFRAYNNKYDKIDDIVKEVCLEN